MKLRLESLSQRKSILPPQINWSQMIECRKKRRKKERERKRRKKKCREREAKERPYLERERGITEKVK